MYRQNQKAFTLVELIVVITILAILWTIAFISLQWYSRDARDSVRVSDLSNIEKQLELYLVKWTKLPIPDDELELQSSWVTIWYQWTIWLESLNKIWVHGWWKDPLDDTYYTYRINANKTAYQVMWYLENETPISFYSSLLIGEGLGVRLTNAADLTKRYPKLYWKTLWVLVDQVTNKPLDKIETGTVELRTYTVNIVDMYLSTDKKQSWTWTMTMYWTMENLARNQNFTVPLKCPDWFIEVPWNRDIWQPSFCVAKYEMSFAWLQQLDNNWDWNAYSYLDNDAINVIHTWVLVSAQWNSPIAEITQPQAIAECEAMWEWYHLITNNEWMTIARNIEQQWQNWSSWNVWEWYIFNGISEESTMWCDWNSASNLPIASQWWTVTWHDICDLKNKLILSNWQEIWDFSWNVWEHVNGANTLDWTNYNTMNANVCWINWAADWDWYSYTSWWLDTEPQCEFVNGYTYDSIWPSTTWLNTDNGIWRILSYRVNNSTINRVFLRGGTASDPSLTGVFALRVSRTLSDWTRDTGFRCSK